MKISRVMCEEEHCYAAEYIQEGQSPNQVLNYLVQYHMLIRGYPPQQSTSGGRSSIDYTVPGAVAHSPHSHLGILVLRY